MLARRRELGVTVVNASMGDVASVGFEACPWCLAVDEVTAAGLPVVVAAGNDQDRVSTPGISPAAITVGGVNDQGTPDPADDTPFGVVLVAGKPDVSAPAVDVMSTLAPCSGLDRPWREHLGTDYMKMAGTSMATPSQL